MSVPRGRAALAPFQVASYRFLWPADLATSWAFEMESLILGWYVLVESGSVMMLSVFGALLYVGTLIAPMMGVIGDRIGHRAVLFAMRAGYTVIAAGLAACAFAGVLDPYLVLAFAVVSGLIRPSDMGVRSSVVGDIMPPALIVPALGVSRTTLDSARIAGALTGAGVFATLGFGPAYLLVTAFYAAGALLTLGIARAPAMAAPSGTAVVRRPSPWRELWEGLVYCWRTPHLQAAMWIAFLANMAGFPLSINLLPYVAREIYVTDQTGLSYMVAGFAFGALAGSIALSLARGHIRAGRMMVVFTAAWFALLMVFAHVGTLWLGIAVLCAAGFVQSLSLVPLSVLLLRNSEPRFRGRVMGVRMLAIYSLPIGLIASGALIDQIGFPATAMIYAGLGLVLTLAIGWYWRVALRRVDSPAAGS